MINTRAMPVLLPARRVALHHRSSSPTVNDFAGALAEQLRANIRVLAYCDVRSVPQVDRLR